MPQSKRETYANRRIMAQVRAVESEKVAWGARAMPSVLRAAGARIEPTTAERLRAMAGNRQQWQTLAWGYRDMIGELRFALQFRAKAISKVKFYIAQVDPTDPEDEPIAVDLRNDEDPEKAARITLPPDLIEAAEAELARLPLADGYGFLGVWSENFDVAGECYLHGYVDRYTRNEVWKIRSVDDVDISGRTMTVKDELGQPRRVNLDEEELYRLWVPHPRRSHLADSALNALMDVLEDISLIGRELRAAARSRIMTNGVVLIPDGMVRVRNTKNESDRPEDQASRFMTDFTGAMLAPISNEGDAGAVVPMVLTGQRDDLKEFRHVKFEREDSPTLLAKLEKALGRLASSLDIPPEILTGMAQVNHWTAWQIDNSTFRQFLEPSIRMMVDSLTAAMLRAALAAQGFPPDQVARIRIWYTAGQLTENPNRRQDTLDALDRALIGHAAGREGLGFGEQDAPSPEEMLQLIAAKQGIDQSAALAILQWAAEQSGAELPPMPAPAQLPTPQPPARADADPAGTGGTGTPATAPPAVAASLIDTDALRKFADEERQRKAGQLVADIDSFLAAAGPPAPGYRLDTSSSRALMEIDRALRDTLLQAADAALTRARERAGSRLRAKATRVPSIAASLRGMPVHEWPAKVGRTQALQLGADTPFLLAEAWEELSEKFARWVLAAIERIVPGVLKLVGYDPDSREGRAAGERMHAEMVSRIDSAWSHLQVRLEELADAALYQDVDGLLDDGQGEMPDVQIPPYLIRTALAEIGGLPETSGGLDQFGRPVTGEPINGLHNGSAVADVLEEAGVITVGYLWVYGITPMRRQFEPHRDLEGERFTNWSDPKLQPSPAYQWVGPFHRPGDHRGCMCDFVEGYAVPEYAEQVRDRLTVPTRPTQDILDLADMDDAAGRTGTTAQEVRDQWRTIQALQARFLKETS